jgi:hypothetical protein
VFTFLAFVVLVSGGGLAAARTSANTLAGFGWGVVAWLAIVAAYGAYLTILDWRDAPKFPDRVPAPWWLTPSIWVAFVTLSAGTIALGIALFRR